MNHLMTIRTKDRYAPWATRNGRPRRRAAQEQRLRLGIVSHAYAGAAPALALWSRQEVLRTHSLAGLALRALLAHEHQIRPIVFGAARDHDEKGKAETQDDVAGARLP